MWASEYLKLASGYRDLLRKSRNAFNTFLETGPAESRLGRVQPVRGLGREVTEWGLDHTPQSTWNTLPSRLPRPTPADPNPTVPPTRYEQAVELRSLQPMDEHLKSLQGGRRALLEGRDVSGLPLIGHEMTHALREVDPADLASPLHPLAKRTAPFLPPASAVYDAANREVQPGAMSTAQKKLHGIRQAIGGGEVWNSQEPLSPTALHLAAAHRGEIPGGGELEADAMGQAFKNFAKTKHPEDAAYLEKQLRFEEAKLRARNQPNPVSPEAGRYQRMAAEKKQGSWAAEYLKGKP